MILEWKVKCDSCGKIIDATKEQFYEDKYGNHYCVECWEEC